MEIVKYYGEQKCFETAEIVEWHKKRNTIQFLVFYAN